LLRFLTRDFVEYSAADVVGNWPGCVEGVTAMKSMVRDDATGRYVLFAAELSKGSGYGTLVSMDSGRSWTTTKCKKDHGCVRHPDKDDLNMIFSKKAGYFVDMQITWRNHTMRYCDSDPCNVRRVVSAKTSPDGVNWSEDLGTIEPDQLDPPDLEFYRTRPFYLGNTSRIVAHTLQYAPGPPLSVVGPAYGRQPLKCKNTSLGVLCHGPHIHEEWWVGPASGAPEELAGWRRPYRSTPAAPLDAFLMSQPATIDDKHVWIGSGRVYSLPLYRIAGLYSPSNAELVTTPLVVPSDPLAINADAHWQGRLLPTGGCDEGCAAYIYVEILDLTTGVAKPGYDRVAFETIMDANSTALPLQWGNDSHTTAPLAGETVRVRIGFRDAIVYALGVF
jgi:hypothetical protein